MAGQVRDRAMGAHPPRMYVLLLPLPFSLPFPPEFARNTHAEEESRVEPGKKGIARPRPRLTDRKPFLVPELRIYRVWDRPIGPHPIAMFEVNLFTPAQFGAFVPWLIIHRGPLSALLHPNTEGGDAYRDHTQRASWLGTPVPLNVKILRKQA
jgi:aromatic ring-cleaving dioxygenase